MKQTVHYGQEVPACHTRSKGELACTTKRNRVTCDNCIRTVAYKRGKK